MANRNPSPSTRFQSGKSGNPKGRTTGARDKLSAALLRGLSDDFEREGPAWIAKMREERPEIYARLLMYCVPAEVMVRLDGQVDVAVRDGTGLTVSALIGAAKRGAVIEGAVIEGEVVEDGGERQEGPA